MKKTLLIAVVGAVMAMSSVFAQHTQSLAFTGPAVWTPGTTVTLSATLTYAGYSSFGFSYWLEVPNALAPFLQVNMPTYFPPFYVANTGGPWPTMWSNIGARSGYMSEDNDLGAQPPEPALIPPGTDHIADIVVPPGTYHIADIPISVLAGAIDSPGTYTLFSTSNLPRTSTVYDQDFNQNNIPAASFVFTIVPEPSALALLGLAAVGSLMAIRRRKA